MDELEYIKKSEELLSRELPVGSPDELMKAAMAIESLGYMAIKLQSRYEKELIQKEMLISNKRAEAYSTSTGKTVELRKAEVDAKVSELVKEAEDYERMIKFYKNLSSLIDRRVGLVQSTLANYSAQIKAGIINN